MDDHLQMIEDCEARESRMSNWERDFIASCSERLGEDKSLTPGMSEKLEEIWDKVTAGG